jgi:Phosphotransferase enzyme family
MSVGGGATQAEAGLWPHAAGWAAVPTSSTPRWWLPSSPGGSASAALSIYQPITRKARVGWSSARMAARLGALRLLPTAVPPESIRDLLAPFVPAGGRYAVMRANHPQRFVALIIAQTGRPAVVAKVALSADGQRALDREARALVRFGRQLHAPLRAPAVVASEPGILVTEAVDWRVRTAPWKLPVAVAGALGELFRATENAALGVAHGDCAPWNLLRSGDSWVLVDWERATASAPPFHDVFHFIVQSHVLIRRPNADAILAGLGGRGWIGAVTRAYADAAGVPAVEAIDHLLHYLRPMQTNHGADFGPDVHALDARRRLLSMIERWASRRVPGPAVAR